LFKKESWGVKNRPVG